MRSMKEMYDGTRREYETLKCQMGKIQARMEDQLREFKRAQEFFEDDGDTFQVVGKGKKKQGIKTGSKVPDRKERQEDADRKVREWELSVIAESTTEASEMVQDEIKKPNRNHPVRKR